MLKHVRKGQQRIHMIALFDITIPHSNNTHTLVINGGTYQPHGSTIELKSTSKKPQVR
jgi:hypothetical protein